MESSHTIFRGQYVSGEYSSKGRLKWMQVRLSEGDRWIKLPKEISYLLHSNIKPGATVQVWARPKKDYFNAVAILPSVPSEVGTEQTKEPETVATTDHPFSVSMLGTLEKGVFVPSVSQPPATKKPAPLTIQVCRKGSCRKRGSDQIIEQLNALRDRYPDQPIRVEVTGCMSQCKKAPVVSVRQSCGKSKKAMYTQVQPKAIHRIVDNHLPKSAEPALSYASMNGSKVCNKR